MDWLNVSNTDTLRLLNYPNLIEALREGFRSDAIMPARARHEIDPGDGTSLFVMPAWQDDAAIIVKIMAAFPGNSAKGLRTSHEFLAVLDRETGRVDAMIDSIVLTHMRTAATSALAASFLARPDAKVLSVFATGPLAPYLAEAHASIRNYTEIIVWGRNRDRAEAAADQIRDRKLTAIVSVADQERASCEADVITAATRATLPIIRGEWLKPGVHIDLVGGYKPDIRESDDDAIGLARIFVDHYDAAIAEPGDIVQPLESGIIRREDIFDLAGLCLGKSPGRRDTNEKTVFKSVGCGLEDLYAARLLLKRMRAEADTTRNYTTY